MNGLSEIDPAAPIGVFDSGVGGLTVLEALRQAMPNRNFIYFGDTARVPYGSKPPELVRRFAWEISGFLLRQGAAALVVACNTASSVALPDRGSGRVTHFVSGDPQAYAALAERLGVGVGDVRKVELGEL